MSSRTILAAAQRVALVAALSSFAIPAGAQTPAGHPPTANPHGAAGAHGGGSAAMKSGSFPDPSVPAGQVIVDVLGADGQPIRGLDVKLSERFESIAEGNDERARFKKTDANGKLVFDQLDTQLRYSYGLSAEFQGAHYEVDTFRASDKSGQRARLVVFPSTADPLTAKIGMRGYTYVQLREGTYHFEVFYQVYSMGKSTWLPQGVTIDLPARSKAIDAGKVNKGPRFAPGDDGQSVRLQGGFAPGQHDVRFTFDVPARNQERESFRLTTLPNLQEFRVLSDHAPGVSMSVPGFAETKETRGPEGNRMLITGKQAQPGQASMGPVTIELEGLPVIGPGRWIAVASALGLAGLGLFLAFGLGGRRREEEEDREKAKRLILEDLALLEHAHQTGEVGPRTYKNARRELLDALARLLPKHGLENEPSAAE